MCEWVNPTERGRDSHSLEKNNNPSLHSSTPPHRSVRHFYWRPQLLESLKTWVDVTCKNFKISTKKGPLWFIHCSVGSLSNLWQKQTATVEIIELFPLPQLLWKCMILLDGLASDQDAVSSVFFRAVRDGPDLHCIFLEYKNRGFWFFYICARKRRVWFLEESYESHRCEPGWSSGQHLDTEKECVLYFWAFTAQKMIERLFSVSFQ